MGPGLGVFNHPKGKAEAGAGDFTYPPVYQPDADQ